MRFPIGEMSVGDLLDRSFKLMTARLPLFLALQAAVIVPVFGLQFVGIGVEAAMYDSNPVVGRLVGVGLIPMGVGLLALVVSPLIAAANLFTVAREYVGQTMTVRRALAFGVKRWFMVLLVVVMQSIMAGVAVLPGAIIATVLTIASGSLVLGLVAGVILVFIPMFAVLLLTAFAPQATTLEATGPIEAFKRSYQLVAPDWLRIAAVVFIINFIIVGIPMFVTNIGLEHLFPSHEGETLRRKFGFEPPQYTRPMVANTAIKIGITIVVQVLYSMYQSVTITFLYLDARIRREGLDLELEAQRAALDADEAPPR